MSNERWVPLGVESIKASDDTYVGCQIRFTPVQFGQVRAQLLDAGQVIDETVGVDFWDAYYTARSEWVGAEWINREE